MEKLFGLDEEGQEKQRDEAVEDLKPQKRPFAYWKVGKKEYKLKLNTAQVCKLEDKYRRNLLALLTGGDMPTLSIMLTVIQAAAAPWNNGVKNKDIEAAFDRYVREGGTQLMLYTDVIIDGILQVSGFFTENQIAEMTEKVDEARDMM